MTISYDKIDTVLDIDAIELSADGFNVLRNNSFKQGLDYWFSYNDFSHLAWHVKNTFLQLWFETGWLGVSLFLALLCLLVLKNFKRRSYDSLLPAFTTSSLGLAVFGVFGSPLDAARVSWMFYFFLFAGLAKLRVRHRFRAGASRNPG
jgi:O-antigen ligase